MITTKEYLLKEFNKAMDSTDAKAKVSNDDYGKTYRISFNSYTDDFLDTRFKESIVVYTDIVGTKWIYYNYANRTNNEYFRSDDFKLTESEYKSITREIDLRFSVKDLIEQLLEHLLIIIIQYMVKNVNYKGEVYNE